jgi:hypothetical protein
MKLRLVTPFTATGAVALLAALAAPQALAGTEGDWFASLYTGEGTELRADERVFALYAIFNATGYDVGPVTRKDPVPKVAYHPVRQTVRARVLGGDPEVRKAAESFFDTHQQPMRQYLAWAAVTPPPPFASGPKSTDKEIAALKGFDQVLAKAWNGWKLGEVMGQVQSDYRKALKTYLTAIDGPLGKAQKTLKVAEGSAANVLVLNLLDASDTVRAVRGEGEVLVVVGPSDKPNVEGVLREYARLQVDPVIQKKVSGWAAGQTMLKEAQLAGAADTTVAEYAGSLIGTAVALKAMDANDLAYDVAAQRGYFGVKDVAKMFDEGKPLDAFLMDALSKAESKRPSKK